MLIERLAKTVPLSRVYLVGMLTLLQQHLVAAHVMLDFSMITMELLHLTASHDMETVQIALTQPIQIEQAA